MVTCFRRLIFKRPRLALHKGSFFKCSTFSENPDSNSDLDIRLRILDAALKFVPEFGWTKKTLAAGAEAIGLPAVSHSLITGGGAELVLYLNFSNNRKWEDSLKDKCQNGQQSTEGQKPLDDHLYSILKERLEMTIPYQTRWKEALALMALPLHMASDWENLVDLSDKAWYYCGDRSVSLRWYSRRLPLALAYRFTELSLIQDVSENNAKTWNYLQRQIGSVISTDSTLHNVKENCEFISQLGNGVVTGVRNMLGIRRF